MTSEKIITRYVLGKTRKFKQFGKNSAEFDEIGLKRTDFKKGLTMASPQPEGWFHIKKKVNSTNTGFRRV